MASRKELEQRDASNKGPMTTSSRGNVDHIHAVEQAIEMEDRSKNLSSSSPDQIHMLKIHMLTRFTINQHLLFIHYCLGNRLV